MSAPISILNVQINQKCNNDASIITDDIVLDVFFEVHSPLQADLEWKLIYIGSAKDTQYDQEIDSFTLEPQTLGNGVGQFTIESSGPDLSRIPSKEDLFGVTAIILSANYLNSQFFRCGFYVYNFYNDPELIENDPPQPIINKIQRKILQDKPRVTVYNINWNPQNSEIQQQQILQDITNQNQNYGIANLMPGLFEKSNGIFDKLGQIPTYNPPQMQMQDQQQQQQQQQQPMNFANVNNYFQQNQVFQQPQQQQIPQQFQQTQNIF